MLRVFASLALLLGLPLACSSESRNDTLIVLEVSSDLAIPGQLDKIDIDVAAASGAMVSRSFPVTAGRLPVRLALVPEGNPAGAFTATVIARAGTQETLRQVVSTSFVANEARLLPVFLGADCLFIAASCMPGQTCRAARCVATTMGVTLLPLADAGAGSDARPTDGPPPGRDGPDAAPMTDTAPPVDTPPVVDTPPGVDQALPVDMALPVDLPPPMPDMPPPPCGAAGQACCAGATPCQGALSCSGNMCGCTGAGLMCGATCVNRLTDPKNCGACGHDCLGGTCAMGACTPVSITPVQEAPINLTIDTNNLYFRRGSGASGIVARLPKTAGAAVANMALNQNGQGAMVSDDSRLYFFGNRQVSSCAIPACAGGVQMLAPAIPTMTLGTDIIELTFNVPKSRVFWSDGTRITSVATVGGATRNHFTNNMRSPVALDANFIYYVAAASISNPNRTLQKLRALDPPMLAQIVDFPTGAAIPREFSMTTGRLFWNTGSNIAALPLPEPAGTAIPPAFFTGAVSSIFVEGTTLFFGSGNTVRSCPVTGCGAGPRVVANPTCAVREVVADARAVYWICGNGELMKIAR